MQSPSKTNLIGSVVDQRYRVLELIGESTNSWTYKAEDLDRSYCVALKVLKASAAALDAKAVERFKRGAETAKSLAHPNIVRLYSFNTSDDMPFFVMDCVQGQNLGEVLKTLGPLSESLCISVFIQVCDALEHAHARGVVHRNLKPSNIMLISAPGDTCMVKIADFGVAKLAGEKETRQSLAKKGEMLGNPLYMSPEQCTGGMIDERADIYAAGCLLFECLTGKPPYSGNNSFDVMNKHVGEPVPDIKQGAPALKFGNQLNLILKRAMAKKANGRYQSAGEMSHDMNLLNEVAEPAEWEQRAVAMREPVVKNKVQERTPMITFDMMKPALIACAIILAIVVVAAAALVGLALADADVPALMRYKVAVQEIVLSPKDERLIRNLNYMTDYYKAQGKYAEAWAYKAKVLKANQVADPDAPAGPKGL